MKDVIAAVAQVLALENSAMLSVSAGVACDQTNRLVVQMAHALSEQMRTAGVDLLALRLEGETLVASIDESAAPEPLCPGALRRVVRGLSLQLCGRVLDARIEEETPEPAEAIPVM